MIQSSVSSRVLGILFRKHEIFLKSNLASKISVNEFIALSLNLKILCVLIVYCSRTYKQTTYTESQKFFGLSTLN